MADREDLEKLFDAALHEREAPSRFGTPVEQRKTAPAVFQKADEVKSVFQKAEDSSPFQAASPDAGEALPFGVNVFQAAPPEKRNSDVVVLDEKAATSLDKGLNAELEAILEAKIAKEKRSKRVYRITVLAVLLLTLGGGTGWVVMNPERYQAFKDVLSEIRSVTDIAKMVESYQKSLDKVAERGRQVDAASESMGVDLSKVDNSDPTMDKEMKEMMGEDGGKTTADRDKILREKFDSVEKTGGIKVGGNKK
jgi:hypothetical protein